jgi:class 3 adenylate cyclase
MPVIDYTVVACTGRVLAGDLGAEKLQGFDVIGDTVNRTFRLSREATRRRVSNLFEASTIEPLAVGDRPAADAVPDAELEGETVRLFSFPA